MPPYIDLTPRPEQKSLSDLESNIRQGRIKIPRFQRDFVWNKQQAAALLDSILKGYPVGTFILWRTRDRLREVRNIGDIPLPPAPDGDVVNYVLDGQQRLTSLMASLWGVTVDRDDGAPTDFRELWVDLSAESSSPWVVGEVDASRPNDYISVYDLHTRDFTFLASFAEHHHGRLSALSAKLRSYQFSIIAVDDAPMDVATEIFTRINITGRRLSLFEIMVAKTFSESLSFDLSHEMDVLMEELAEYRYDTVANSTVLQLVSAILEGDCTAKTTLNLAKEPFIQEWPRTVEALRTAVDYFRQRYRIPVSQLLPYNALLVPFGYYFRKWGDSVPSRRQEELLEDFFWRASLGARYSLTVEQRLGQDIRRIDQILEGEEPSYTWGVDLTTDFIRRNGYFRATRSYVKAILVVLANHAPLRFSDNALVTVSNESLKRANSRNYHHIFPRAYLRRQGIDDYAANHVANIAFVDADSNMRLIRDKAPSKYFREFQKANRELASNTSNSHLFELDETIWRNDYEGFLEVRLARIRDWLRLRLIPREGDSMHHEANLEDDDPADLAGMVN